MSNQKKSLIVALIDRTGSMDKLRSDTEGAFDNFIKEQLALQTDLDDIVNVTLIQFDTEPTSMQPDINTVYENKPLAEVPPLRLIPRGWTPLNDAVGTTIVRTEESIAKMPENERPAKIYVLIATDGLENASKEYTNARVKEMVTHHQSMHGWQFIFLGVGIDAFAIGRGYGIAQQDAIPVAASGQGVYAGYGQTSSSVSRSRTTSSEGWKNPLKDQAKDNDKEENKQ